MPLPSNVDQDKLSEAALAILGLTAFRDRQSIRASKGMDWDRLDQLYARGWIGDPKGKAKSVAFTTEGTPAYCEKRVEMKEDVFKELLESVRQGGEILRGEPYRERRRANDVS